MRNAKPLALLIAALVLVPCTYAKQSSGAVGPTGGMAGSHMTNQGLANTNGPNATDRDKGLDRAADRRNEEATEHSKAMHPKKHMKLAHHKRVPKPEGAR